MPSKVTGNITYRLSITLATAVTDTTENFFDQTKFHIAPLDAIVHECYYGFAGATAFNHLKAT